MKIGKCSPILDLYEFNIWEDCWIVDAAILTKTNFIHDQIDSLEEVQEVFYYFSPTTTTESKPGSCKFLSNSILKKYKLNLIDRVA